MNRKNITGLVLSGGAGSRLGGLDKGLQRYKGKTLIEHVTERMNTQVDDIILCVNRNHDQYKKYGYQLISDTIQNNNDKQTRENHQATHDQKGPINYQGVLNYQGPMAGIVSVIKFLNESEPVTNQYLLISSCDSPELPTDYAVKLYASMVDNNATSAVVHDGKRSQNLHCLIHCSAWASLLEFYQSGERAMHKWHKKNNSVQVNFTEQAANFLNINSTDMFE